MHRESIKLSVYIWRNVHGLPLPNIIWKGYRQSHQNMEHQKADGADCEEAGKTTEGFYLQKYRTV